MTAQARRKRRALVGFGPLLLGAEWKVFIDNEEHFRRASEYVNENPLKEGSAASGGSMTAVEDDLAAARASSPLDEFPMKSPRRPLARRMPG